MAQHPEAAAWRWWHCKALPLAATCSVPPSCDLKFTCKGWQTDSSQSSSQLSVSQSFHRDGNIPGSVKSVQHYLNSNIYTGASACCRTDGLRTDRKTLAKHHQNAALHTQECSTLTSNLAENYCMPTFDELYLKGGKHAGFFDKIQLVQLNVNLKPKGKN